MLFRLKICVLEEVFDDQGNPGKEHYVDCRAKDENKAIIKARKKITELKKRGWKIYSAEMWRRTPLRIREKKK